MHRVRADRWFALLTMTRALGGHALRSVRGRAETIGAHLEIGPAPGGRGTRVALALPTPGGSP